MFEALKVRGLKISAATTVQIGLREAFRISSIKDSPVACSHGVVERLHQRQPAIFSGQGHPRPHKFSVAAFALAMYCRPPAQLGGVTYRMAYVFALNLVLLAIQDQEQELPLHDFDKRLIASAVDLMHEAQQAIEADPEYQVIDQFMTLSEEGKPSALTRAWAESAS